MAYTEAQWNKFQLQLPLEDRLPYSLYLTTLTQSERLSVTPVTPPVTSDEPSIYSQGGRIDMAGNYNAYNPEMAAAMSSGTITPVISPNFNPAKFRAKEAADSAKTPKQSISAREALAQRTAARKAETARIEADYQAYLLEKKKAEEDAAKAAEEAKVAAEAAAKAAADAKAAQEAADKAAADAAAATAAEKAAADAKAAELAAEAAAAAELAAATAANADATATNAEITAALPGGTPAVIPDATGPQGPEFYNKLKGKAQSGTPLTPEENAFVGNFLKHRAGILGGLQFQGKQLTAEQLAEKNFLVGLGYIAPATPATPPTTATTDVTTVTTPTVTPIENDVTLEVDGGGGFDVGADTATDVTATDVTPERPAGVNQFFVYNPTTKTWERPAKPQDGATYSWDDNTGWVQETPGADKPAGTPAAYIYDEKTKTWIKPPMPTGGKKYTWDDTKGWTEEVVATGGGNDAGGDSEDGDSNLPGTGGTYTQADIDKAVAAALAKAKTDADAAAAAAATTDAENTKNSERQSVIKTLKDRFARYGLDSLAKTIEDLAVDGATESTITLALQETDAYKTRFSANDARLKKGLKFLDPAEYLNAEDEYRQKLRDYGLKDFDNDAYVKQFIANDTSLTEISNRIVTAVQRVQNADPAILKQLDKFYGIKAEGLVAYMLDPEQQFEKIKLQVASAEIGVEAGKQGLSSDMGISEQLAKQGVTQAEAQKGYATVADILPTAEKLSAIYGGRLDAYNQSEGEQEVFNSLASAQRKRQKLSAAEIAQFSGSSGLSKTSLMDQTKGTF